MANSDLTAAEAGGPNGETTSGACKCGAGRHPLDPGICAAGHALLGNMKRADSGQWMARYWTAAEGARAEIVTRVMRDKGFTPDDVPAALQYAADGLAQSVLVRDSAFARMARMGGPLTSDTRTRRVAAAWAQAADRVIAHLRLLGLERREKLIDPMERAQAWRDGRIDDDGNPTTEDGAES